MGLGVRGRIPDFCAALPYSSCLGKIAIKMYMSFRKLQWEIWRKHSRPSLPNLKRSLDIPYSSWQRKTFIWGVNDAQKHDSLIFRKWEGVGMRKRWRWTQAQAFSGGRYSLWAWSHYLPAVAEQFIWNGAGNVSTLLSLTYILVFIQNDMWDLSENL